MKLCFTEFGGVWFHFLKINEDYRKCRVCIVLSHPHNVLVSKLEKKKNWMKLLLKLRYVYIIYMYMYNIYPNT